MPDPVRMAPSELSDKAKHIWQSIDAKFELNESELFLLEQALMAYGRLLQVRAKIKKHGTTVHYLDGAVKPSPLLKSEMDLYSTVLRLWKEIGLGRQYLDIGRPPVGAEKRHGPKKRIVGGEDLD